MSIDLKHSIILQKQIKNAIRTVCNLTISEIDKDQIITIKRKSFTVSDKNGKHYEISLEIKEENQ